MGRKRSVKSKRDFNPADDSTLVLTMCSIVGCGHSEHADSDNLGVVCSYCLTKMSINLLSEREKLKLFSTSGKTSTSFSKPRGWRWMKEFVDKEGNVYHKGVEQLELKGSKPITDIDAIKAKQRANKEKKSLVEQKKLLSIAAEKKEIKKAIKKQKDFLDHKVGK
jgi:hypothetical protein